MPITVMVSIVLLAGYIALLNHEERAMEEYYRNLRETNAELYLAKIVQARGFRVFLTEFLSINDYSQPVVEVPPFLVGRWALFDKERRVSDDFIPEACLSGLEIQDGKLRFFGDDSAVYAARYTMAGAIVTAHLDNAEESMIEVVGYGSHLHHIIVKGPGGDRPRYGYMCR